MEVIISFRHGIDRQEELVQYKDRLDRTFGSGVCYLDPVFLLIETELYDSSLTKDMVSALISRMPIEAFIRIDGVQYARENFRAKFMDNKRM